MAECVAMPNAAIQKQFDFLEKEEYTIFMTVSKSFGCKF